MDLIREFRAWLKAGANHPLGGLLYLAGVVMGFLMMGVIIGVGGPILGDVSDRGNRSVLEVVGRIGAMFLLEMTLLTTAGFIYFILDCRGAALARDSNRDKRKRKEEEAEAS